MRKARQLFNPVWESLIFGDRVDEIEERLGELEAWFERRQQEQWRSGVVP